VSQSSALAAQDRAIKRAGPRIAAQFAAPVEQSGDHSLRCRKLRIEQQRFHRPADPGAAQLGVERNGQRLVRIGGAWM
jgi:hypothetical protein